MPLTITVEDLVALNPNIDEDKAKAMIRDAMGIALFEAPCLRNENLDPVIADAARAIIHGAILRWNDQGSGGLTQLSADVFGMRIDNRQPRQAGGFYQGELKQLRRLCTGGAGAYSIDLAPMAALEDEPPWMEFVDP